MSDLADPATVLAVLVEERYRAVQAFLNSNPVLSTPQAQATALFVHRTEVLMAALRGFCEACDAVGCGGPSQRQRAPEKHVQASQVRKGQLLRVPSTVGGLIWVRVTKREKWNATRTKIHFEDQGDGLPTAQFGADHLPMTEHMYDSSQVVTVRAA